MDIIWFYRNKNNNQNNFFYLFENNIKTGDLKQFLLFLKLKPTQIFNIVNNNIIIKDDKTVSDDLIQLKIKILNELEIDKDLYDEIIKYDS